MGDSKVLKMNVMNAFFGGGVLNNLIKIYIEINRK
jgi:hypothetical protein